MVFVSVFWAILAAVAVIAAFYLASRKLERESGPAADMDAVFDGSEQVTFERVAGPDDRTLVRAANSRGYDLVSTRADTYADVFVFARR